MRRWAGVSRPWRTYALLAGVLVIFVIVGLAGYWGTGFDPVRDHSSERTNPWGTKAYRELLQRCGLKTATWDRPLTELTGSVKLLMLFDPQRPISEEEQERLLAWVRAGGRLVLAPFGEGMDSVPSCCRGGACAVRGPSVQQLLARLGLVLSEDGEANEQARVGEGSPLTADVRRVKVPSEYRLERFKDAKRLGEKLGRQGVEEEWVAALKLPQDWGARVHLLVDGKPALVTVSWGRGEIHVLAEVEMLANGEIAEADNVVLAANLAFAGGAPSCVHFDEYHHSTGRVFGAGGEELDVRPVRWTMWAILAVAVIYALGRAQRFGAPVVKSDEAQRSSAEYVRAFAEIYWRAQASGAALEMLAAGFRRRLAQAVGVPLTTDERRLAEGLRRRGLRGVELVALLRGLMEAGKQKTSVAELVHLARRIEQYERML